MHGHTDSIGQGNEHPRPGAVPDPAQHLPTQDLPTQDLPTQGPATQGPTQGPAQDPAQDPASEQVRPRVGIGDPLRPAMGWTEIGVGAVCYLLLSVLLGGALTLIGGKVPPTVLLVAVSGVAALGAAAIAVMVRVRRWAAVGLRRVSWRWLLFGVAGGVLAKLGGIVAVLAYMTITGDGSNPQQDLADAAAAPGGGLVAMLAAGAVLVPLGEELLFRGVLYGGLRRYGVTIATVVSAGVFGLVHGINAVLPAAMVLGVINALLYERSRSIWPSVVAHVVLNAIGFALAALLLG